MSAQDNGWGSGWPNCQGNQQVTISGGGIRVTVRHEIAAIVAWCLNETVRRGYVLNAGECGGYNCRQIRNIGVASNHSWGLAVDLNWNENGYGAGSHTIPDWVVAIWTGKGFRWGGSYSGTKDWMHFEFMGTPGDAARISASLGPVPAPPPPPPPPPPQPHPAFPGRILRLGVKGQDVKTWQQKMLDRGWRRMAVDGDYGPISADLCGQFQQEKHLQFDHEVGPITWNATWS